jgi:hypothetical protein
MLLADFSFVYFKPDKSRPYSSDQFVPGGQIVVCSHRGTNPFARYYFGRQFLGRKSVLFFLRGQISLDKVYLLLLFSGINFLAANKL